MYELWQLMRLSDCEAPVPVFLLGRFDSKEEAFIEEKDRMGHEIATIITDKEGNEIV